MTDKQIIIDDCIHLDKWKHCDICEKLIKTKDGASGKKREHLLTEEDLRCDFYPNCYYKQLLRKEQECERLKKQYNCYACDTCKGKEDYINLKRHCENAIKSLHNKQAEFDQLKAEIEVLKEEKQGLIKDWEEKKNLAYEIACKNEKLKQTLTEIKEIAEWEVNNRMLFADNESLYRFNQILQKISECEGNDENR